LGQHHSAASLQNHIEAWKKARAAQVIDCLFDEGVTVLPSVDQKLLLEHLIIYAIENIENGL